jgi:PTS system mannose-specific IIA component
MHEQFTVTFIKQMEEENNNVVKVGGVIISHGRLASELLAALQTIVGEVSHIAAVSIDWNVDVDEAQKEIQSAIAQVSKGKGVLLLTDMFGGTPTNIASMFLMQDDVEVVTGVNLPMVIRLATQPDDATLDSIAHQVLQQGREGIYLASDILMPKS